MWKYSRLHQVYAIYAVLTNVLRFCSCAYIRSFHEYNPDLIYKK